MSYQKTTSMFFLKYVRYKLNHFTCLHENKITRFLQLSWKISKKLLNQSFMLIHNHLCLKNITIWLMFLRDKSWWTDFTSERIWHWNWFEIKKDFKFWIFVWHVIRWTADATTILEWASCEKLYSIKSFFICISDTVCKEIEQRIMILHWLSSSECDHNLKLIFNFLDSRNARSTLEDMIFHEAWHHSHIQLNLYTWRWWKVHCFLNMIRIIWTIYDVI